MGTSELTALACHWGELVHDIALCAEVTPETAKAFLVRRGYGPDDARLRDDDVRDGLLQASLEFAIAEFPPVAPLPGAAPVYHEGYLLPEWDELLHARVAVAFDPPSNWSGYWRAVQMVCALASVPDCAASNALWHFEGSEDPRMDTDEAFRDSIIHSALLFIYTTNTTTH